MRGLLIEPAANSYLLAERDIYLENPEIKIRVRAESPGPDPTPACTSLPADSRSLVPQGSSDLVSSEKSIVKQNLELTASRNESAHPTVVES